MVEGRGTNEREVDGIKERDGQVSEIKAPIGPSKVILWMVAALWVGWMLFVFGDYSHHGEDECQPDLEGRRFAAWAVSAQHVWQRDLAVHDPAPPGLHPGAIQGPGPGRVQEDRADEGRPYRRILERRAQENGVDFVKGVATAITPMAFFETVMAKGYETLVDPDTKVDVNTGMIAAGRLQALIECSPSVREHPAGCTAVRSALLPLSVQAHSPSASWHRVI